MSDGRIVRTYKLRPGENRNGADSAIVSDATPLAK
jgi:hypothetical protein